MAESEEELKSLLMKMRNESEKVGLKLSIRKTKIIAQWQTLFWGAPKSLQMVTAAMRLKDFFSWKKSYGQPRQHIQKQRHYFANKVSSSQGYDFSSSHVWMSELDYKESWALRIDAFELWCWRRLLRVPWTARRSNQSVLKEISPEYSLKGLMLKLKNWRRNTSMLYIVTLII